MASWMCPLYYAPINVKPQRGGGIYGGFDWSLSPRPRELILIFVPRVGIFEFSDQEWIFETGSCDRKEEHVSKPGTNDLASILKEISFSKEILKVTWHKIFYCPIWKNCQNCKATSFAHFCLRPSLVGYSVFLICSANKFTSHFA
jgi:hypothetical protein